MKFKDKNDIHENSPLGAILFIFHKNNHNYINNALKEYDITVFQALFLLRISYSEDYLCQDDLADAFYLSKGAIAKSLKTLEDKEFIVRESLAENRRKYALKLTSKGEEIIPIIQNINKEWEDKMGIKNLDIEFLKTLKELTFRSIELNEIN